MPTNKPASTYLQNSAKGKFPFPQAHVSSTCTPPNYNSDDVAHAYEQWKSHFFTSDGKVHSPENSNAVLSEGTAYGMLIAVYMNDETMFKAIWAYAQTKLIDGLMTWTDSGASGGSASDADEDMAYALLMAEKQWGGYQSAAVAMIGKMWSREVRNNHLTPGSNYSDDSLWNPSYFAPSYYRAFARATASDSSQHWMAVLDAGYMLLASASGANGLVPNWTNNQGQGSSAHDSDGPYYGYDACRTPFRVALDYCENSEPRAKTYLDKVVGFFSAHASSRDGYTATGDNPPGSLGDNPAGMAFKGPPLVGAMEGAFGNYLSNGYIGLVNSTTTLINTSGVFSYFNGSWGTLSFLSLSGNFWDMTK
jgi:endo-1,4-beta-D-glucanase Y